jgi:hypothetical protein
VIFLCVRFSALKLLVPSKVLNSFEICVLVVDMVVVVFLAAYELLLVRSEVSVGSRTCEMVGGSGV